MNLQFRFFTKPMTLLCILKLFMMVVMLFIALLASLFAKNSWSSQIICLFLFMAKVIYIVCNANIVIIIELSKTLAFFYYIILPLAKLK